MDAPIYDDIGVNMQWRREQENPYTLSTDDKKPTSLPNSHSDVYCNPCGTDKEDDIHESTALKSTMTEKIARLSGDATVGSDEDITSLNKLTKQVVTKTWAFYDLDKCGDHMTGMRSSSAIMPSQGLGTSAQSQQIHGSRRAQPNGDNSR